MALTPSFVRTHDVTHALLALAALTGPVQGLRGQQPRIGTTTAPIVTQAGPCASVTSIATASWARTKIGDGLKGERALDLVGRA
ncbi:MAG: hypothetical protein U0163_14470 [Gemmatimonadaceae bacterium]